MNKKGFTLIELLVVVAVIGILATAVIMGLSGTKKPARDARRAGDLRNIQSALEIFYSKNGAYPATQTCDAAGWTAFETSLTGAGIGVNKVPNDPLSAQFYCYCSTPAASPQAYGLSTLLEDTGSTLWQSSANPTCTMGTRVCTVGSTQTAYCVSS